MIAFLDDCFNKAKGDREIESLDLLRIESEMFKIFMDNKTHQRQISL